MTRRIFAARRNVAWPAPASFLLASLLLFAGCAAPDAPRGAASPATPASAPVQVERYSRPVRVAWVGDSITAGSGVKFPALESHPAQLQRMLDPEHWWVRNFGVSATTLLTNGDRPYRRTPAFKEALAFNPDVVVIMLGTNDTKPENWAHREQFAADYRQLVAQFQALPAHPRIFLCQPILVVGEGKWGINEPAVLQELPEIDAVARELGADVIGTHAVLRGHESLVPDHVHPNADGARLIADAVYHALTGRRFAGSLDPVLHTWWEGYRRIDFISNGRAAFVVEPKTAAPGRPWIWRPEFFAVEPQTTLALLARGWHAAYVDVTNLYGAPVALDAMDAFYARVEHDFQLAPEVVLAGFSRGGLFAFNWAVRHPDRVACIYADAPVLDFKSWPGGRGQGKGSPADWKQLLKVYGLTDAEALAYPSNPIDTLPSLAAAHIPIICVAGDADQTVPFAENAQRAKARYDALGGTMKLIVKPGGDHHPHSLPDPAPIVEFIVAHTNPAPARQP